MTKRNVGRSIGAVVMASALAAAAGQASAQVVACGTPGGPDVIVGSITGPQNYTASGTLEALSLGTTSCNMGNQTLRWNQCPANTHPVIGGNLYRYRTENGAGQFEQVGLSWLKHGFTALAGNVCCTCQNPGTGTLLGIGCSDPYTASRNGSQSGLGPRYLVNAFTGAYPASCPPNPTGGNTGRIEVQTSDLVATAGGAAAAVRYFGESQYIASDDATTGHGMNNASTIEVTTSGSGTAWTFAFLGSTNRQRAAIEHWKLIDPTVTETTTIVPSEGKFIISSKATSLGAGQWHYEYAVYNMNSDRSGGSFAVAVSDCAVITNIGFHDVTYRGGDGMGGVSFSGTDWSSTRSNGVLRWSTQSTTDNANANAIRWGTTYNFRFDANVAPATSGEITLGLWKPGTPTSVSAAAQVPAQICVADTTLDGGVGIEDLLVYLDNFNLGLVIADVDNGTGTCTHDGGVGIEDLLYYLDRYGNGC